MKIQELAHSNIYFSLVTSSSIEPLAIESFTSEIISTNANEQISRYQLSTTTSKKLSSNKLINTQAQLVIMIGADTKNLTGIISDISIQPYREYLQYCIEMKVTEQRTSNARALELNKILSVEESFKMLTKEHRFADYNTGSITETPAYGSITHYRDHEVETTEILKFLESKRDHDDIIRHRVVLKTLVPSISVGDQLTVDMDHKKWQVRVLCVKHFGDQRSQDNILAQNNRSFLYYNEVVATLVLVSVDRVELREGGYKVAREATGDHGVQGFNVNGRNKLITNKNGNSCFELVADKNSLHISDSKIAVECNAKQFIVDSGSALNFSAKHSFSGNYQSNLSSKINRGMSISSQFGDVSWHAETAITVASESYMLLSTNFENIELSSQANLQLGISKSLEVIAAKENVIFNAVSGNCNIQSGEGIELRATGDSMIQLSSGDNYIQLNADGT